MPEQERDGGCKPRQRLWILDQQGRVQGVLQGVVTLQKHAGCNLHANMDADLHTPYMIMAIESPFGCWEMKRESGRKIHAHTCAFGWDSSALVS